MLALAAHLPEIDFEPGRAVVTEGGEGGALWVLVSGSLRVRKGDVVVNTINEPGALVGEISLLLGTDHGATVETTGTTRMRYAADGHELLRDPAVLEIIAVGLAQRLNFVTAYLADLKEQYGDAPGLSMVSEVLTRLSAQQVAPITPGSARDPDPEY